MDFNNNKIYETFDQLFDVSGRAATALLNKDNNNQNLERILDRFIELIIYGLPQVDEFPISDPEQEKNPLKECESSWNIFSSNPASSAMAACIIQVLKSNASYEQFQARQLVSLAVPKYISFVAHALLYFAKDYSNFINNKADNAKKQFKNMVGKLKEILGSTSVKDTAAGIENLIEALMFIRERRVEETPLTIEINLGSFAMWESMLTIGSALSEPDTASIGIKSQIDNIRASIESIDKIGKVPTKLISKEAETNAKHFGRGVAVLKLPMLDDKDKISIDLKNLWSSHENAPLSTLYGFDWKSPNPDPNSDQPELNLVLLPSGVISIQVGGDPLLEYFAGGWRYVDIYHKSMILSKLAKQIDNNLVLTNDNISLPVYRCSRLAYQLSYHNHGSTIDLNFGEPTFLPDGKLKDAISKGHYFNASDESWRLINSTSNDKYENLEDDDPNSKKLGRWVYQLCIGDGITSLFIEDHYNLLLGDFGQIIQFDKDIKEKWRKFVKSIPGNDGAEIDIGGARHTSAFSCAYKDPPAGSKGRMVFCISQDGYIDVYMKGGWLKLR